jgi:6-phosphogluconolactonase
MPKLHLYKNEKETCYAFAGWLSNLIEETLSKQDRFLIALSGGETPKMLYKILATEFLSQIDWSRLHVFWGEEKFVSLIDEKEHSSSALKACIATVPVPKEQVHTIRTDIDPHQAAEQYEAILQSYFKDPNSTFDLVILGMGEQGNVLSLIPNNDSINFIDRFVMPVYDKHEDLYKITLTIPAINAAANKAFIVTGKKKEDVVQQVLKGKYEPEKYPAQLIVASNKEVHWFLDEGAAGKLIKPTS